MGTRSSRLQMAELDRSIWDLHVREGMNAVQIASELHVGRATVERHISKIEERISKKVDAEIDTWTVRERERLEVQRRQLNDSLAAYYRVVEAKDRGERPDARDVAHAMIPATVHQLLLKNSESRRKLMGLDRHREKIEITGAEGRPIEVRHIGAALVKVFKETKAELESGMIDVEAHEV